MRRKVVVAGPGGTLVERWEDVGKAKPVGAGPIGRRIRPGKSSQRAGKG